jgi:hypothetical protein
MDTTQFQPFLDLISQMQGSATTLGMLGAVSVLVYGLVRIFRLPLIQDRLPAKAKWDNWPSWGRLVCLFGTAFLAQMLACFAAGTKWTATIVPALMAGLGAIGLRQVEKGAVNVAPPKP